MQMDNTPSVATAVGQKRSASDGDVSPDDAKEAKRLREYERKKAWRRANPDKVAGYQKKHRAANYDKIRARERAYDQTAERVEQQRLNSIARRLADPEAARLRSQRQYAKMTPEQHAASVEAVRRWRETPAYAEWLANYQTLCTFRFQTIRSQAAARGYTLTLTREQIDALVVQQCYYCGQAAASDTIHSLDRVDNARGYEPDNVVTCCGMCNMMKCDWSLDDFIRAIVNVAAHQGAGTVGAQDFAFDHEYGVMSYNNYEYRARKQNKAFELSREQYTQMTQHSRCVYCNRDGRCGIDRVDNARGYVEGNMAPCCSHCNYMKKDHSVADFVRHCIVTAQNMCATPHVAE